MRRWLLVIILVAAMAALGLYSSWQEYRHDPALREALAAHDYAGIAASYTTQQPTIANREALGDAEAPITAIAVLDMDGASSKAFYAAQVRRFADTYVAPGEARLYHEYYVPLPDYDAQTGRFIKASLASCFNGTLNETLAYHLELFDAQDPAAIAAAHGLNPTACLAAGQRRLATDAQETRTSKVRAPGLVVGIDLRDEETLVGPSWNAIDRAVQTKRFRLGIA